MMAGNGDVLDNSDVVAAGFIEMANHNVRLATRAREMQRLACDACDAIRNAMDVAEPIVGQYCGEVVEYVLPVEDIEALRAILARARSWDIGWDAMRNV